MSKKTYVLDSSVLLQSPYAVFAFDEHDVVLPDVVLEEIDANKSRNDDAGGSAREVARLLESLRAKGSLTNGVELPGGGSLRVETHSWGQLDRMPAFWNRRQNDYRVIEVACGLSGGDSWDHDSSVPKAENVILVTNDINMRVRANVAGITAEVYRSDSVDVDKPYTGRRSLFASQEDINALMKGYMKPGEFAVLCEDDESMPELVPNEYLTLKSVDSASSALAYYDGRHIHSLQKRKAYDVAPKNAGQQFAMHAMMAPADKIPLCIIQGGAGTAKTFLSLACGLESVLGSDTQYRRILVVRPNVKFDETLGFLKGGEAEKIGPLIRPIMDNLDQLTAVYAEPSYPQGKKGKKPWGADESLDKIAAPNSYAQDLFDSGKIVAQAMEYMRGRSITDTYIILDEAQNMTPLQAFGIISRAGYGTKIILVGDPDQIDNPALDAGTNGLSWAAQRMKGSPLCAQIRFDESECVRSPLAKEAIVRLNQKGKCKP